MLPLPWKIFRVASYLHMTSAVVIGAIGLQMILDIGMHSMEDILGASLLLLGPAILLANSSLNVYLLEKFYPDRVPGKKLRRFSVLLFLLSLLVLLTAIALAATAFYQLALKRHYTFQQNILGYLIATDLAVMGLTGCYILWAQVSLRKALRRNYEVSVNSFLDSD